MPVFALLSANAVSQAGNLMALVAVPWFVLQTTGSAAKTGLAGAAIALGAVLAGFLGGPVVDRLGFKRASIVADLASGVTVALIPLMAGHGAGALAGTVLFGIVGHRLPRRLTFIVSFAAGGPLPYLVLAATPPLYAVVGGYAVAGVLVGPVGPLFATVVQERSPQAVRGRVFGVSYALIQAGGPIGLALGGFLIEGVGLVPAVVGMGAVYLGVALGMFLNPTLRAMDKDR